MPIPKLQRLHRWSLGMDKKIHPTLYDGCNYLSMLGLKLIHISKRGPRCLIQDINREKSPQSCYYPKQLYFLRLQTFKRIVLIKRCLLNIVQQVSIAHEATPIWSKALSSIMKTCDHNSFWYHISWNWVQLLCETTKKYIYIYIYIHKWIFCL